MRGSAVEQAHAQLAWVLGWRNADDDDHHHHHHHYAPFPVHPSAADFRAFPDSRSIAFEDEIPFDLYVWPQAGRPAPVAEQSAISYQLGQGRRFLS